jgi:hypothetical protein
MNYLMSLIDVRKFHHDLPCIPLHYTYATFTSLHFTSFLDDSPHTFTSPYLPLS